MQQKKPDSETATVPRNVSQERTNENIYEEKLGGKWNKPQDTEQENTGEDLPEMYITVQPCSEGSSEADLVSSSMSFPSQSNATAGEMYITVKPREDNSCDSDQGNNHSIQQTLPTLSEGTFPDKINQKNFSASKSFVTSQRSHYRSILPKIDRRKSILSSSNHSNDVKDIPRCSECHVRLGTYKELIAHNYTAHGKLNTCPICNKFFMSRGSFIRHGVAHMQRKCFKCSVCFAYFSRKDNLKRHFKINHKNIDWQSVDCESVSNVQSQSDNTAFPTFPPTADKPSKLNSIVDNLHSRKGKLPLLRSILTTPKPLGRNKHDNKQSGCLPPKNVHDSNPQSTVLEQSDSNLLSTENKSVMGYICSSCKAVFHTVRDLKSHIVRIHGEEKSSSQPSNSIETSSSNESFIGEGNQGIHDTEIKIEHNVNDDTDSSGTHSILQVPTLIKQESDEIDIESWVRSHYNCDNTNNETAILPSDNQPCFPSQFTTSLSSSTSSQNHFYSSTQHSNPITMKNNQNGIDNFKPKKRRIAAHNEMTACKLCGVYLVTGAEIVQHGQQSHPDELEAATCAVCFTKLSGYDALYRHCQLHFGKTFSCQFCKSKFTRKDNLTRHVKNTHTKQINLNTTV